MNIKQCIDCGGDILLATYERTGGYCMPCKKYRDIGMPGQHKINKELNSTKNTETSLQRKVRLLTIPGNINSLVENLPKEIITRVENEFDESDQDKTLKIIALYGIENHEPEKDRIYHEILNRSNGHCEVVEDLVATAKTDYRDLFYSSSSDPYMLIDKLLKKLRVVGIISSSEIKKIRQQQNLTDYENQLHKICTFICSRSIKINQEHYDLILKIAEVLNIKTSSFDYMNKKISQ